METIIVKNKMIKQFANESPCICFNLRKAARAITQIYDNMFREIGLTAGQLSILRSLDMIGPMTVCQLSEAMATDRTTITRNLKPLEREKLIFIKTGYDRRSREIEVSKRGQELMHKAGGIFKGFQERLYKDVGKEKMEKLCKDLDETLSKIQGI